MAELITTTIFNDANLKAYYRFESGALTTDATANTHTLTGIGSPASTTGKYGGGVDLSAATTAYSAVDGADFHPGANWSIGAWVKNPTANNVIFQSYSANTNIAGILLYVDGSIKPNCISGKNTGTTLNTDYKNVASAIAINGGNWHLVVATYDGSNLKIYVDNNTADSVVWANAAGFAATSYVRIGCENDSGSNLNFNGGQIDEAFFLKGTALSASDVQNLYTDVVTITSNSYGFFM